MGNGESGSGMNLDGARMLAQEARDRSMGKWDGLTEMEKAMVLLYEEGEIRLRSSIYAENEKASARSEASRANDALKQEQTLRAHAEAKAKEAVAALVKAEAEAKEAREALAGIDSALRSMYERMEKAKGAKP